MDACTCPIRGYCERRGQHINPIHYAQCQAGKVAKVDTVYERLAEARKARGAEVPKRGVSSEKKQTAPPRWVRILRRFSKPEDIGLGATAKRIAAKVGGERFKRWSKRIGLPCGCTDREVEWNRKWPNPQYQNAAPA